MIDIAVASPVKHCVELWLSSSREQFVGGKGTGRFEYTINEPDELVHDCPDDLHLGLTRSQEPFTIDGANFSQDPPPDLVVEVDITHTDIAKNQFYASLCVPEFWRFDGKVWRIYALW